MVLRQLEASSSRPIMYIPG